MFNLEAFLALAQLSKVPPEMSLPLSLCLVVLVSLTGRCQPQTRCEHAARHMESQGLITSLNDHPLHLPYVSHSVRCGDFT